jgi:hypothetical protein
MKKSKYKPIPISAAKEIAKKYDKQQVIIVAWDAQHGREHVTTYGTTKVACEQAATGGNKVKKALGWAESLCDATPNRAAKKLRYEGIKSQDDRDALEIALIVLRENIEGIRLELGDDVLLNPLTLRAVELLQEMSGKTGDEYRDTKKG